MHVCAQETVKPEGVITDLRTHVTGVTAADLEGVTCDLATAQTAMLACLRQQQAGRQVAPIPLGSSLRYTISQSDPQSDSR